MQLQRPLVAVALATALTSCALNPSPAEEGSLASGASTTFPSPSPTDDVAAQVTHAVPDSSCPVGWAGLEVSTDGDAGVGDLDDVVACTDGSAQRTYLENRSRVVWLLSAATVTPSIAVRVRPGPVETSFLRIVRENRGQEAMLPGSAMTANLPPADVSWVPDLPLTFAWEGHALTLSRLQTLGASFALAALTRQNTASKALVACALAIEGHASSVNDIARADAAKVVLTGLGADSCRTAADDAGVADQFGGLRSQTQRLKVLAANLRAAADSSRALPDGAQLLTR